MTPHGIMARRYFSGDARRLFFPPRRRMRNRRERGTGRERARGGREGGRARTIADAITIFIRANVNAPPRSAPVATRGFDASAFKRKMDPPLRPRALLNNRYCHKPVARACRESGSNACFKESRRFRSSLASGHLSVRAFR